MFLSTNLQYLRRKSGNMTQEKLAQRMGVSRQTVSKWESGEAYPELTKLLDLCDIFACRLDPLLREDMAARDNGHRPVRIVRVPGFRIAKYIMISLQPKADVFSYMDTWATRSGLLDFPSYTPKRIGWDFPYVSSEQKNRFGLRGYCAAYILPQDFEPACGGPEISTQEEACYAVMTLQEPFDPPRAYQQIMEYLSSSGYRKSIKGSALPCFEWTHQRHGVEYMDIFIHCEDVPNSEIFEEF